ncbi:sugar lactone lactonase YvrE [Aquimarina sp. EL_43]|uniref:cadherin domain-containing protein n=1 Tax=unclassified Aquimarina TaxID=2627091 RepID=UPI0018C9D045|nr:MULTISPECIES: cadherin domain-containing protein [unclassified Aquimarina]MBG6129078.1 sugar lactone lactonase YvrE [Aquimarina sp. EL_35]MBG6150143.1 sugar lactone lactonase YvrE [Aquimarina sp. EL_32]MBG6167172.1 sugar lactone lactonase YvrE [Aquimarina sp. EL_43]
MKTIKLLLLCTAILLLSCSKDDDATTPLVNKAPEIAAQSFNVSESAADADVFGTVKATDADQDELSYSITANSDGLFEITKAGALSLIAGKTLDFETKTTHEITVEVTDGKAKATAKITITVIDVDENMPPVIAAQSFTIAENSSFNTVVGSVVATDPDGDTLTYTLTNSIGTVATFEIVGNEIKLKSGVLNYEDFTKHNVTITVDDGTLTASAQVTINVTDVNEAPTFPDRNYSFTKAEDIDDTVIIATVTATDPEGATLSYSLQVNPGSLFEINSSGEISLVTGKSLDYETVTTHNVKVRVTDGNLIDTQDIIINVTDVNEDEYTVSPWMGNGTPGLVNAVGQSARFDNPKGMVVLGNNIYIADADNHVIRHIDITTGAATIFAGSGVAGSADHATNKLSAQFRNPSSVAVDRFGNIYVADTGNHSIRKITATSVTTIAGAGIIGYTDGNASIARFRFPTGITVDEDGFNVYVADHGNHAIRRISIAGNGTTTVSTIAGNGSSGDVDGQHGTSRLNLPTTIALHKTQNLLYITDTGNNKIKTIPRGGSTITTLVSNGTGFARPYGIVLDQNNDIFYTANYDNHKVYKSVKGTNGDFTTTAIAGSSAGFVNGPGSTAKFRGPWGIGLNTQGVLFVSEFNNHAIRKITKTQTP